MNTIIICLTIIIVTAILCITIYHIKFIDNPELPKRMRWINNDILETKRMIRDLKENGIKQNNKI